jgi:hypothetical protein
MTPPAWRISGQYYETCNCDFLCPCVTSQLGARPSKGACNFAMGFRIEHGRFGDVALDGLGFVVLGMTPEAMNKGNWTVGVIADERASAQQRDAITAIASGAAGGPMAALAGLVGNFAGVTSASIAFGRDGAGWSVKAGTHVDMAAQPAMGINPAATGPLELANTGHPASDRLMLAHPTRSHVDALGFRWDDTSGRNNGQYAPFAWQGG